MIFNRLILSCVLSLSVSLPAMSSGIVPFSGNLDMSAQEQGVGQYVQSDENYMKLLALANAGDESAQLQIIYAFCSDKNKHMNFKDFDLDAWTVLKRFENDNHEADQCACFATQFAARGIFERYPNLVDSIKNRAEQGSAEAKCILGTLYHNGEGVEQDYSMAFKLYTEAAELNLPRGFCNLGVLYQNGFGVNENMMIAKKYYKQAAKQNDVWSMNHLAGLYETGNRVNQNYQKAIKLYTQAAEAGCAESMCNLAELYENGFGLEANLPEAIRLTEQAAAQGYPRAQGLLAEKYRYGFGVNEDLEKAAQLHLRAAEQGYVWSQFKMGSICEGQENFAEAIKWYTLAADSGDASAQHNLGALHENGCGVEKNYAKALLFYELSAEQEDKDALTRIGLLHCTFSQEVDGIVKDADKAFKYLKRAVEAGSLEACKYIGPAYLDGLGVQQNMAQGLRYTLRNPAEEISREDLAKFFPAYVTHNPDAPREENKVVKDQHYSPMSKLFRVANHFGIYESTLVRNCSDEPLFAVAPFLRPLCVSFMGYVNDLSRLEVDVQGLPVLMNVLQPTAEFQSLVQEQFKPAFFHSFALEGENYLTLGEKNVERMQYIQQLMDEKQTGLDESVKVDSIPYLLVSNALWSAGNYFLELEAKQAKPTGCVKLDAQLRQQEALLQHVKESKGKKRNKAAKIRHFNALIDETTAEFNKSKLSGRKVYESLCSKLAEEACSEIKFPAIETMGQAKACVSLLETSYQGSLELLKQYNSLFRETLKEDGIVYSNESWHKLIDKADSILRSAQSGLAPLMLLDDAGADLKVQIRNVAQRNDKCLKDSNYEPVVLALTNTPVEEVME